MWIDKNTTVPDHQHEPYILDHLIQFNPTIPSASKIRIAISTKTLLKIAMKSGHICADATYKLTWHNFPVFLTGINLNKKIHTKLIYL